MLAFTSLQSAALWLTIASTVHAATVSLNWTISWIDNVNPDGLFPRRVIGVNGKWPIDEIHVTIGDTLVLHATNHLDMPTSLHAHGLYQNGTNYYDGAFGVTECGIAPGTTYTYNIPIQQTGTYWLHGHHLGQYVDGFRTSLILHPTAAQKAASKIKYDDEIVLSLSDWYHQEHKPLNDHFLSIFNPTGREPIPNSGLINHNANTIIKVKPGTTYLLRVITMSALAMFDFFIEGHELSIVEVDGEDIEPYPSPITPIAAAQRYAFLFTTKNTTNFNFRIHADMDMSMFDNPPNTLNGFVNATLQYSPDAPMFVSTDPYPDMEQFDEMKLVPAIPMSAIPADQSYTLDVAFEVYEDGVNHGTFNRSIFQLHKTPSMFTALSMTPEQAATPSAYGPGVVAMPLGHMKGIHVIIYNRDPGQHPFHLHGHKFQIVNLVTEANAATANPYVVPDGLAKNPPRRDTVVIPPQGFVVIRFLADNPGVWLFHCHIEWHLEAGLAALFIEAPDIMQKTIKVPQATTDQCKLLKNSITGNAFGHDDVTSFDGARAYGLYPTGFTPRGAVALAATILCAILGLSVVVWYAKAEHPGLAK
ncbi:ferroxidase fet3 [Batrachochytrium dendrobatidis]|nr:ferroxidase fet3 [Batrachochytrium dendrobatidis]KAK5669655.1 ferroxidase fet3 [Batrachochytrium dendrobatidis]